MRRNIDIDVRIHREREPTSTVRGGEVAAMATPENEKKHEGHTKKTRQQRFSIRRSLAAPAPDGGRWERAALTGTLGEAIRSEDWDNRRRVPYRNFVRACERWRIQITLNLGSHAAAMSTRSRSRPPVRPLTLALSSG